MKLRAQYSISMASSSSSTGENKNRKLMKMKIRSPSTRPRPADCLPSVSSIRSPLKPVRLRFENEKRDEFPKPAKRVGFLEDDDDFQKHFGGETWFDDDNGSCTWLSADNNSPSSFFDDYRFSGILGSHHVFDDRLVFWLSKLQKAQTDKSLEKDGDLKKVDEAENRVLTSIELEMEEAERASLSSCNSSRLSTTRNGSASNDSAGLTNQDSSEESGNGFSAPSNPSSGRLETQTSISISSYSPGSNSEASTWSNSSQNVSENEDRESCVGKPEPIFWPFEGKFDCNLEEDKEFLRMSPRKKVKETVGSNKLPLKSVITEGKFDPKQRPPRRLRRSESNAEKSYDAKLETGKVSSKINSNKRIPRLSKGSKNLAKVVPVEEDEGCVIIKKKQTKNLALETIQVPKRRLEKERSMDEESIESIIGLDEFDGHEGVDAELDQNEESFSHFLLISPR